MTHLIVKKNQRKIAFTVSNKTVFYLEMKKYQPRIKANTARCQGNNVKKLSLNENHWTRLGSIKKHEANWSEWWGRGVKQKSSVADLADC